MPSEKGKRVGGIVAKERRVRIRAHTDSMRESGGYQNRKNWQSVAIFLFFLTDATALIISCLPYQTKD